MPNTTPGRDTLFCEAVEIADAAARAAYLDRACGTDTALRAEVGSLVDAHFRAGGDFLRSPAGDFATTAAFVPTDDELNVGATVGPYKLRELVGEGGMGLVFVADQAEPVRRRVALKVIKPGMDSRQAIARFEAERQALALMDHPNIAKVLDAGTTNRGRLYFVMELVRGQPLTEYCDANRLTVPERLGLFLQVCWAVQHAHQKGVIHRDLKPNNILVAVHDVNPVAKVIDFGIAKAVGQSLTDKTVYTGSTQFVGTPLYMSPEQAGQSSLDVDTRTDIYSLGVLLYELLTGVTPIDPQSVLAVGPDELRLVIREVEPVRPSARLSTLEATARKTVCDRRNADPRRLAGQVRGDLDWVVMRCLEKDRNRRYESAGALAADVQRYLDDETVLASPPSFAYRLRKLVRRNRVVVVPTVVVIAALISASGVSLWQAVKAERARVQAEEHSSRADENYREARAAVRQMLVRVGNEKLAVVPDASEVRQQLLEDAATFYTRLIARNPDDAQVYRERAAVYRLLARYEEELADIEKAITLDPKNPDHHMILAASLMWNTRNYNAAPERRLFHAKKAVELSPTSATFGRLADVYLWAGQAGDAAVTYQKAAELATTERERLYLLAQAAAASGNRREELACRKKLVEESGTSPWEYIQLCSAHLAAGEAEEALAAVNRGLELRGISSFDLARLYFTRAEIYTKLREYGLALADYNRNFELSPEERTDWTHYKRRAFAHFHLGHYEQALADVATAIELRPEDGSNLTWINPSLVAACPDTGFRDGILRLADRAVELTRGRGDKAVAEIFVRRGWLRDIVGRDRKQAMSDFEAASRLDPTNSQVHDQLARHLATCTDPAERDPVRAHSHALKATKLAPQIQAYWNTLGIAEYRNQDWVAAVTALEKSVSLRNGGNAFDWYFLSMARWQLGEKDEARRLYDRAAAWTEKNRPTDEELLRFRAEAAELLGVIAPPPRPTGRH